MSCSAENTFCGDDLVDISHGEACDGHLGCASTCAWEVPTCSLDASQPTITLGDVVTFTMNYSTDNIFHVTNLRFGDGRDHTPSQSPIDHTYQTIGAYTASYSVLNRGNGNVSTTCTAPVTVNYPCGNGVADPGEECNEPGLSCSVGIACNTNTCKCEPTPPLT